VNCGTLERSGSAYSVRSLPDSIYDADLVRYAPLLCTCVIAACAPTPDHNSNSGDAQSADSIILERVAEDTIAPAQFGVLTAEAERVGFARLPNDIQSDSTYCPMFATDHSSVTVAIYNRAQVKRVRDYLGCNTNTTGPAADALAGLRHFESLIDSLSGAKQWARPPQIR
jgi:hypothetical protein